jgi:hypothetical protein
MWYKNIHIHLNNMLNNIIYLYEWNTIHIGRKTIIVSIFNLVVIFLQNMTNIYIMKMFLKLTHFTLSFKAYNPWIFY